VITSDHNIFKQGSKEFSGEYEYVNEKLAQCPFIIISPNIESNICLTEAYKQMDIYPTILPLIGCKDSYYWKGFGVNLLDSTARENRPISDQEALVLSDEIIRADWFKTLQK
jgi:phosphoglycerol transferase MdoB-like AlkP superfamily enzyme